MSKVFFVHTTKLDIVKWGVVPAATIALSKEGDKFKVGVTICSKYDNFSKKYGREIAQKRLDQGFMTMDVPKPLEGLNEKEACLTQIYQIASSVVSRSKKWKKKITRFEQGLKTKVVPIETVVHNSSAEEKNSA